MNSPPKPRLSTTETALLLNLCQATIVPFGGQSEDKHDVHYLDLTLTCLQPFGDGDPITDVPGWLPGLAFPKRDPRSWHLVRYLRLYGVDLRHSPYCRTLFDLP